VSARRDVALVMAEHALAERYACKLLEVDRSTYRYEPRPDRNAKLQEALWVVARQHPRYGYRRLWALLVRQGWEVNEKRIHRLYKAEGMMVRRLKRKRLSRPVPVNPLLVRPNQEWAMDFVSDALATGRALRTFNVIDSYTKESLAIEVGTGISSRQVIRVLERVMEERGVPGAIRCDNVLNARTFLRADKAAPMPLLTRSAIENSSFESVSAVVFHGMISPRSA
jgi:putative transposase